METKNQELNVTIDEDEIREAMITHNITRGQALGMLDQKKRFEAARGERTNFLAERYRVTNHTNAEKLAKGLGHQEILVQTITESRMNEKKVSSARYQFIDDPVDSHDEVGPAGIEIIYELVK